MAKRKVWLANNTQIEIVDASDFEALAAELAKLKDARAVRKRDEAMSAPSYTPDQLRAQIDKMWLRRYPDGPTDETWILNVGIGAGMLSVAANRIAQLEAALRDVLTLADINKPVDADALTAKVRAAWRVLGPTAETKAKQFAPIDDGTICSNCTKTIGYHYQTAEGDLFCEVPKETKGDANG